MKVCLCEFHLFLLVLFLSYLILFLPVNTGSLHQAGTGYFPFYYLTIISLSIKSYLDLHHFLHQRRNNSCPQTCAR